jgi:hypothetical protein
MATKKNKTTIIIGNNKKPTKFVSGQVVINKEATEENLERLTEINNQCLDEPKNKVVNDATEGGLLKGKPHYDKNGKPLGGIQSIVDNDRVIEVEGNEFVLNKCASKKHWRELSRINQSAGNGVPILPPDEVLADADEYKKGGNVIKFNPNKLPQKWLYDYALKIKKNYPKVWDLGGNIYGNTAFENLETVLKRGYWKDSEEWFFVKWQSFNARHSGDFLIAGVIANLKWLNVVDKGWKYMKNLIEEEVEKRYGKKMATGGRFDGINYDDDGNVIDLKVGDKVVEFRKRTPNQPKSQIGGQGEIVQISGAMAKVSFEPNDYQEWIALRNLKRVGDLMKKGGGIDPKELAMGIKAEQEHNETYKKVYDHEITPEEAPKHVAIDHLKEMDDYYTRLAKMEGLKKGGKIAKVMREFKEGTLKSSSGDKVTDIKQAIAIGLSEQRRHEAKMELGGSVTCRNCGHSWHKADNHSTKLEVCHLCGTDNTVKMPEAKSLVEINKATKMEKSEVFYNPEIFTEEADFILGGFNAGTLNDIVIKGDNAILSKAKLEYIFKKRLEMAIAKYKEEVMLNLMRSDSDTTQEQVEREFNADVRLRLETILELKTFDYSTENLIKIITEDSSFQTWSERVYERAKAVMSTNMMKPQDVVSEKQGRVTVSTAEELTENVSLEAILEQLGNINEQNII